MIQKAADLATAQIVADMTRAPDGILRARARLASWLDAAAALLRDLQPTLAVAEKDEESYRARLHTWQSAFAHAVAQHPQETARWSRVLLAAWLVALGVAAWQATVALLRRLERQRVALAQEGLSRLATHLLQRGLFRAYSQLARELAALQTAVEEALADLAGWAHAEPVLESGAGCGGDAPTRAALVSDALWADVWAHIHGGRAALGAGGHPPGPASARGSDHASACA